jgi:CheY-like chemotaxis protein
VANAKILLVDDDELVRLTLCKILERYGFDTGTAASVPEALKLISSETYDVLLSDLHMPGAGDCLTDVARCATPIPVPSHCC